MIWKNKYELGVELIDEQHKELFQRVDSFVLALRAGESWDQKIRNINDTLEFMKMYVVEHFQAEEEYQALIGYPGMEEHKKIHKDMVSYVTLISDEYERLGFDERLMQQFGGKLLAWLIHHVATEDQKIADFAKKREEA